MRRLLLCLLVLGLPLSDAGAQPASSSVSAWPVAVGDRVRVPLRAAGDIEQKRFLMPPVRLVLKGRVVRQTVDSLYVQQHPDLAPVAVSHATAQSLYVTRGHSRTRSALTNAVFGAVIGLAITNLAQSGREPGQSTVDFYAPYIAAGAGLGVIHGILSPSELWRRVR